MAKKILVVDDDLYIRELYEEVLKDEGYEIETAKDGKETLGKAQQGGYDLILLDIMMPKLDGLGVMDELKKNPPARPNGPILLLTNLDHDPLIKDAMSKGASAFIIKADITPADLIVQVKKFLGESN
ncbi:MAG: response regulator transcription factor [Candidatus Levyibacteriota bacterium]